MVFFKRPKKRTTGQIKKKDIPDGLWIKCPSCEAMLYIKEWENNKKVCPHCEYHSTLTVHERIEQLIDSGSFHELDGNLVSADPLNFKGPKTYSQKLSADTKRTGIKDAIITGTGSIEGHPVVLGVTDSRFIMGSMGSVLGEKFARAAEEAIKLKRPFIVVSGSGGGARMYEGCISLMQMAKTSAAVKLLDKAGLPFISVLTSPTMAGVLASFASLGDLTIAEPKALIGFTGPRVIKQTIQQELPDGFQLSEFLLEHGMVDVIVNRLELKNCLARVLRSFLKNGKPPKKG